MFKSLRSSADISSDSTRVADEKRFKVMFLNTSVGVGGAESLLVDLVRRLDRERFDPELCCLKGLGVNGEILAREIPAFHGLIRHKFDARVIRRLARLMRERQVDAIVSVGAGDKAFWGRIAARLAGVPVVIVAIHSTGWPDRIGRLNRLLTRWTDAFIALAGPHRRFLIEKERFPPAKVRIIPNGIDVDRFSPRPANEALRRELGLPPNAPVAGIVARLRSEKNIELFLNAAAKIRGELPAAHFLIVGDGPDRAALEERSRRLGLVDCVHFLGNRSDVPDLLALMDVFVLTSHIEASPVSILEAFAMCKPCVATRSRVRGRSSTRRRERLFGAGWRRRRDRVPNNRTASESPKSIGDGPGRPRFRRPASVRRRHGERLRGTDPRYLLYETSGLTSVHRTIGSARVACPLRSRAQRRR